MTIPAEWLKDCRRLWQAGLCLCCGGELCGWKWNGIVHEPTAIAEGVMMCGRCIGNNHQEVDGLLTGMLRALVP